MEAAGDEVLSGDVGIGMEVGVGTDSVATLGAATGRRRGTETDGGSPGTGDLGGRRGGSTGEVIVEAMAVSLLLVATHSWFLGGGAGGGGVPVSDCGIGARGSSFCSDRDGDGPAFGGGGGSGDDSNLPKSGRSSRDNGGREGGTGRAFEKRDFPGILGACKAELVPIIFPFHPA